MLLEVERMNHDPTYSFIHSSIHSFMIHFFIKYVLNTAKLYFSIDLYNCLLNYICQITQNLTTQDNLTRERTVTFYNHI